jgi:hypothetical protein
MINEYKKRKNAIPSPPGQKLTEEEKNIHRAKYDQCISQKINT